MLFRSAEPFNRAMYSVHQGIDDNLLRPVAVAYRDVVPVELRLVVRNLLGNLQSVHQAKIKVGNLHFHLSASAIKDANGKPLGSVVEWRDRTAEVDAETEISGLVDGATQGDFSRRLNLSASDPFYQVLSTKFNELIETVSKTIVEVRVAAGELTSAANQIGRAHV